MIDPGSEFRDENTIRELWENHENWPKMEKIISSGVEYPLEEISEEEREKDLLHMIARGNHKSAQTPIDNARKLEENYTSEVKKVGCYLSQQPA